MHTQAHTTDYSSDAAGANLKETESLLGLLARAIQQFHTYPAASTMCVNAVDACQRALVQRDTSAPFAFRVAPRDVIVDDVPIGRGSPIEHELARRLHTAAAAQVSIERTVTARELSRFCEDLIAASDRRAATSPLIERLAEHGVERITVRPAYRPEVLEVGTPASQTRDLLAHERRRREEQLMAQGAAVNHLYPPDKGWVRVDPSARLDEVSLVDLALLTGEPSELAAMLLRLTDDDAVAADAHAALTQKFSDVAMLFASLEPRLARVMFSRLARAVLDLDPEHRQTLLRRTILPGLLDGKIDGAVLKDFPDLDLADSLCLLLDLETAAPEVVSAALARLDLPAERQAAVVPLLEQRMQGHAVDRGQETSVQAHARRLVHVDRERARSLAEFAAFDLGIDAATASALRGMAPAIAARDIVDDQLACLWRLTRLEPNPESVQRFLDLAAPLTAQLERAQRWEALAGWLSQCRALADTVREPRPDVADVLDRTLARYANAARAAEIVRLAGGSEEDHAVAAAMIHALGRHLASPLLALAADRAVEARARTAAQILSDHASIYAAVVAEAETTVPAIARVVARVLGSAGPGYEAALGRLLDHADEQTVREAFRSLARIGTPQAAALVSARIEHGRGWIPAAAEQTLWRFPRPEPDRHVRELLTHRDFVARQPDSALRLLERLTQAGGAGLDAILRPLAPLRYRIWNPPLARIGRRARAMLTS
ncbi:MAG TPA: hypothetical protein VFK20_09600 [Vicinamibacterales bacterium]|nr:hypothetical protein [Vicinamibacterales bacterium]